MPKQGQDWLNALRNERKRLKFAFELDQEKREKYREYRTPKNLFFDVMSKTY